jgi:hypothetical protein
MVIRILRKGEVSPREVVTGLFSEEEGTKIGFKELRKTRG